MVMSIFFISVITLLSLILLNFFHKTWLYPMKLQKIMEKQGIKGPSYKFLHGSTKEAAEMVREAMNKPLMELSHDIAPRVQPQYLSWFKSYGKNLLTWHGSIPQLVISEPDLIKEVLSNRDGVYIKVSADGFTKKLLGDGIVTAEGKKWIRLRKLANHAFRTENVKGMIPAIVTSVEDMLKKWTELEGKEIDLFQQFQVMASDVISRTAFGSSYIQGKDLFQKLVKLVTITAKNTGTIRLPLLRYLFHDKDEKESGILDGEIREIVVKLVKQREERNTAGDPDGYGSDLLGLLVKANHASNKEERVAFEEIIDECKTFYFAGQETTVSMLAWTCLLLAINTDWQHKAREEVKDFFVNKFITSDDANNIARLKTMTMILNESLRLYPPIVLIIRKVAKDVKLGKYFLPKDLQLYISPLTVHHDPELWGDDAHLFKPERFSDGIAKATNHTVIFTIWCWPKDMCWTKLSCNGGQGCSFYDIAEIFIRCFTCLCACPVQTSYQYSSTWASGYSKEDIA